MFVFVFCLFWILANVGGYPLQDCRWAIYDEACSKEIVVFQWGFILDCLGFQSLLFNSKMKPNFEAPGGW